jgi:hypothetical protein
VTPNQRTPYPQAKLIVKKNMVTKINLRVVLSQTMSRADGHLLSSL